MPNATRRLVVVRHAKSAWPVGVPDNARPLGPRGRRDAPVMAQRIRDLVGTVDVVVRSPTARTGETWELMQPAIEHTGAVFIDDRIYHAWGSSMLDVVRELPDDAATALIVGHEPGVSELVLSLADGTAGELRGRVADKFPTCGVAVLAAALPWHRLSRGSTQFQAFTTPRD